jgi:hypothetical protein
MKLRQYRKPFASLLGIIAAGAVITAGLGGCNTLQSIEINREPSRTVYGQGQELDRSGLVVTGHFKKDSREVTNERSLQISGYDKGKPGKQTVTVAMRNQSAAFTVTVVPAAQVAIQQPPAVTVFMQGDGFDPAGLIALVKFENGAVQDERIGPDRLSISGYDKDRAGNQTLTADYYGKRASFGVRVAALTGIAVVSPPDNIVYFTGEDLDLAGLVVNGVWEDIVEKPVSVTRENLSSFDKNRAGKQDVFVTYLGKTASFPVTFVAMQALSVSRPPAKLNYENGEELDLDGMAVLGTRAGAASIELVDISRLKISGYDRFKEGNQTVTVTLGGKSAAFRVTVAPSPFVGTWHGIYSDSFDKANQLPMTLVMSEDSWKLSWEKTARASGDEYSGTFTRDRDSGKYAELLLVKYGFNRNIAPTAAEILSSGEMKLTGGIFGRDGLIFTK